MPQNLKTIMSARMAGMSQTHWPLTILGGLVSVLNMLLPIVLVRILGRDEMGEYKVYFLYMALLPWICLTAGVGNGLSHWAGHKEQRMSTTRASWALLLMISVTFLILSTAFRGGIGGALGWGQVNTMLLIVGVFITMLSGFFDDVSVAWGSIVRGALFSSGFDLLRNIAMVSAALYYRSVVSVFIAHIGVFSLKLALGTVWGWRLGFQKPLFNWTTLKAISRYAMPVSMAAALGVGAGWSDQVILSDLLISSDFALYSFGCLLVPPLMIFEQSVNRVLIPAASSHFAKGDTRAARLIFRGAIGELAWLHFPAATGMMIYADQIVEILYTKEYAAAAVYMRLFALNYIINHLPYDSIDRARGRGGVILKRLAFFSVVSPIVVFAGFKGMGAIGALVGALSANALMRITALYFVCKTEGWTVSSATPLKEWGLYAVSCVACLIFPLLLRYVLKMDGVSWFLISGALFSVAYFCLTIPVRRKIKARIDSAY